VFSKGDLPEVIRLLDRIFGKNVFSLKFLFRDEQRKVLARILESTLVEAEGVYLAMYERHAALLRFLTDLGIPLPKSFRTAAEFALNLNLRKELAAREIDVVRVRNLVEEAGVLKGPLDGVSLGYILKERLEEITRQWRNQSTDLDLLKKLREAADLARSLPLGVDFWRVQNLFFEVVGTVFPEKRREAEGGGEEAKAWVEQFSRLGEKLSCRVA